MSERLNRMKRVLVTRPEPAAAQTAARLRDAGFQPVLLPLSRTVGLSFAIPDETFDALTITSANAFRHVAPERLRPYRTMPLFAVGEGTAKAAQEAGFSHVIDGGGDAVRLAGTLRQALPQNARVLYLAGRVRQPVFEDQMAATGLTMSVCDVYDTELVAYGPNALSRILGHAPFVAVMLYSGVAAASFVKAMHSIEPPIDEKTRFLCISGRVAAKLPPMWQQQALVSDHPDENGLFRLFSKL